MTLKFNQMKTKIILFILLISTGCTTYSTKLNELQKINVDSINDIKKGESCSRNLFGGFSIPYIGDTAIRISGDQSVIQAIKNANIKDVYAIDNYNKNYFLFYSKRCTVVFGK